MQGVRYALNRPALYPGQPIAVDVDDADFHLRHLVGPLRAAVADAAFDRFESGFSLPVTAARVAGLLGEVGCAGVLLAGFGRDTGRGVGGHHLPDDLLHHTCRLGARVGCRSAIGHCKLMG